MLLALGKCPSCLWGKKEGCKEKGKGGRSGKEITVCLRNMEC